MKLAFSTSAYARHPLLEAVRGIAQAGFEGVEIVADVPHGYPDGLSDERVDELRRELDSLKLRVSNVNANSAKGYWEVTTGEPIYEPSILSPEPTHRAERVRLILRAMNVAKQIGAGNVSITSGRMLAGMTPERAEWQFRESMKPLLDRADALEIDLAIAPVQGLFIESADEVEYWIHEFKSPRFGVSLSMPNCQLIGESIPWAVAALGRRMWHVEVSDMPARKQYALVPGQGTLPWPAVGAALQKAKYERFITVALPSGVEEPQGLATRSYTYLSRLF